MGNPEPGSASGGPTPGHGGRRSHVIAVHAVSAPHPEQATARSRVLARRRSPSPAPSISTMTSADNPDNTVPHKLYRINHD
jgi:hypothetical protein